MGIQTFSPDVLVGTGELLKNCRTVLHMPIQVYMLTIKQPIGISEKGFDCALGCLRKNNFDVHLLWHRCSRWCFLSVGNLALSRALGDFVFKKNDSKRPEEQIVTGRYNGGRILLRHVLHFILLLYNWHEFTHICDTYVITL